MSCEKIAYKKYKDAEAHINSLRAKSGGLYRLYKCNDCGFHHVATVHKHKLKKPAKDPKYPIKINEIPKHPKPVVKKENPVNPRHGTQKTVLPKMLTPDQVRALKSIINNNPL